MIIKKCRPISWSVVKFCNIRKVRNISVFVCISTAVTATSIYGEDPLIEETSVNNNSTVEMSFSAPETAASEDPREHKDNSTQALITPFGQLNWKELSQNIYVEKNKTFAKYRNFKLELSLDPKLQEMLEQQLHMQRHISGAIVLLEAATGRIIAVAEKKGDVANPLLSRDSIVFSARAPAASLMKMVTASATIEKTDKNPDDEIYFNGGCKSLHSQNWLRDSNIDRQHLTFAAAFGKSCNTPFARLAIYDAGLESFKDMARNYYFNRPIPSDILLETSAAFVPHSESATAYDVGLAGAGFGASTLSPVHAALLSAAVSNGGVLMAPHIVDVAYDLQGKEVYRAIPTNIGTVFSVATAGKMVRLMQETILGGTSRKYFRRKGTKNDIFDIGGKTGTLSDPEARQILYTWFTGIAPIESRNGVAIGTLIASPQNWVVRAGSVAQAVLARYLQMGRRDSRVASAQSRN